MSQHTTEPPTSALDLAEEFLDRTTPLSRIRNVLHRYPAISPAIVLVLAVIVFGLLNDRFLNPANLSLITQQVAVVGTLAIAQTLIILTAGIDLSVGAVMVLSSMVIAQTTVQAGLPAVLGLFLGLVVGLGAGALNGFLVTRLKLPPFIVTLGTLNIFVALTLLYSGGATVRGAEMPALLTWTGSKINFGIAFVAGVLVGAALVALLRREFRLEGYERPADMLRYALGGALMGVGGVLALGCTVGNGLTGIASLAPTSFIALPAMVLAAAATLKWRWRSKA